MKKLPLRIAELSHPLKPKPTGHSERLSRLAGIRAVLFDIYGTLLVCGSGDVGSLVKDAGEQAGEALRDAGFKAASARAGDRAVELLGRRIADEHLMLKRAGVEFPEVDIRDVWEQILRDLEEELLLQPESVPSAESERQRAERLAVEYECRVNPAWSMPGLDITMNELRGPGLRLGVVSNAQFYTRLVFDALAGADWTVFDPDLCVLSYELREAKPSTRLFRVALDGLKSRYGILPAETLFVGNDMLNDVAAASASGCRTALFAGDARSLRLREGDNRCVGVRPDLVVTSLTQLPGLL